MKLKTVRLDPETRRVLLASKIDGNRLTLQGQLPRDDYARVAKAIEAAGGKWNKKDGCHIFPADVRETMNLTEGSAEVVNVKQTFQAFYTPPGVAGQVCEWANLSPRHSLLEPSAGQGALIKAAAFHGVSRENVTAVEINPKMAKGLSAMAGTVTTDDFLNCFPNLGCLFDQVLMNPPFERGSDIKHICHAVQFVKRGGRLVSICADGPKQREKLKHLCEHWIELEPGAFRKSGTNVNAAIVVIER